MNTNQKRISRFKVGLWFIIVNTPLLLFTIYAHSLLHLSGNIHGECLMENTGMWMMVAFKFLGVNFILGTIFSDFKIVRS